MKKFSVKIPSLLCLLPLVMLVVYYDVVSMNSMTELINHNNSNENKYLKEELKREVTQQSVQPSESFPSLRALVVGLEHSGTTMAGRLIMNAPCVIGAGETGYLLAETPAEIHSVQPWFEWNNAKTRDDDMWYKLQPNDIDDMKNAKDFVEMYNILRERSHLFNDLNDEEYCEKPYQIVDKTPRYVYPTHFEMILKKNTKRASDCIAKAI
mmetsp:Transcript_5673/g.6969  ORF Transcript_5673/g.6969 Transcript_5673/m.6969 type:complete len:210 (+) Transcript_5673:126-755(+)